MSHALYVTQTPKKDRTDIPINNNNEDNQVSKDKKKAAALTVVATQTNKMTTEVHHNEKKANVGASAPQPPPAGCDSVLDMIIYLRELFNSLNDLNNTGLNIENVLKVIARIEYIIDHPDQYPQLKITKGDITLIKKMLNGTISSNGMSLGRFLVFILAAKAYGKNGNMDDVLKEMDEIQKIFGKDHTLGFVKQILEEMNHIRYNPGAFIRQLRDYGLVDKDDKPIKEYYDEILYGSLDTFMMNSNYDKFKQLSNHCFNQWFDNHFYKNGHYINPSFVYHYMLLRLAGMDTDLAQSDLGGFQTTDKILSDLQEMMDEASKLIASGDKFNAKTAQEFMKTLLTVIFRLKNDKARFGDLGDRFESSIATILQFKKDYDDGSYSKLADDLNGLDPAKLSEVITSASGIISGQSSANQAKTDQISANIKQFLGFIKSDTDDYNEQLKNFNNNSRTS